MHVVDLLDLPAAQPPPRVAVRAHQTHQNAPEVAVLAQKYLRADAEIEAICGVRPHHPVRRTPVALVVPNRTE